MKRLSTINSSLCVKTMPVIVILLFCSLTIVVSAVRHHTTGGLMSDSELDSIRGMDQVCSSCVDHDTCTDSNPPNMDCGSTPSISPPGNTCTKDTFFEADTSSYEDEDYCSPAIQFNSQCNVLTLNGCVTYDEYQCEIVTEKDAKTGKPTGVSCYAFAVEANHVGTQKHGSYTIDEGNSTECGM